MVTQEYNSSSIQIIYLTSSDTKPTDCDNGSVAVEVNTGRVFRFDKENTIWYDCGFMVVMF